MTESRIDRRSLIAAAGVGALAACTANGNGSGSDRNTNGQEPRGWYRSFGLEPNFKDWSVFEQAYPSDKLPSFVPKFITLVRVTAAPGNAWKLDVNHASIDATGLDQIPREDLVNQAFDLLKSNSNWRIKQLEGKLGKNLYPRRKPASSNPSKPVLDIDSFDYLGSNSPVEIYIWVDIPGAALIDSHYISFSPLSSAGKEEADFPYFEDPYKKQAISPNDSYFSTRFARSTNDRNVIQIRNYFKDYDFEKEVFSDRAGDTLKPRAYGLNIHFAIMDSAGKQVSMVIDPDTGNGSGWEP